MMNILFNNDGRPYKKSYITRCILNFGSSYNETVYFIIRNTAQGITEDIFKVNCARLLSNFKMTRQGPFKGIKWNESNIVDPKEKLARCWQEIGEDLFSLRQTMDKINSETRGRFLVNIDFQELTDLIHPVWQVFKKILPISMGKSTMGLVGASKILFASLPEIALPVDNQQWLNLFKTVDYGDIILRMAGEISEWEKQTGENLDSCDSNTYVTLPSVYNVMAMNAR